MLTNFVAMHILAALGMDCRDRDTARDRRSASPPACAKPAAPSSSPSHSPSDTLFLFFYDILWCGVRNIVVFAPSDSVGRMVRELSQSNVNSAP